MRLLTYDAGHGPQVGRLAGETVFELSVEDMLTLIRRGGRAEETGRTHALGSVQVLAPIPRPHKNIYCVGLNYAEHNQEFTQVNGQTPKPPPAHPILFSKVPGTVIGPGASIESHPEVTRELDYEAELAVVIGRGGRDIAHEDAEAHIFGYTIVNDVTARDLQRRHQQWLLAKSLDTFCPMGPLLVTADEVAWPSALEISTRVNGEVRQDSNTRHLIFDIPTLIATISCGHTLEPGDIIATGTCAGVGMGFNPPRFLRAGDVVEVEIEGLGLLSNPVR